MIKEFNELPAEIQERMLQEQERQGNPRNAKVFEEDIEAGVLRGGFTWEKSVEGLDFWLGIILYGDFTAFYERYPKRPQQ